MMGEEDNIEEQAAEQTVSSEENEQILRIRQLLAAAWSEDLKD